MAVFALGNIYRASVRWLYGGSDEQVNVWHFQVMGGIPATEAEELADFSEVLEDLYGTVPTFFPTALVHQDVTLYNETLNNPMVSIGALTALNGTSGTDPLPTGVAAFIYAKTNRSRTIGRKFLPVFTEGHTAAGVWTSTVTDELVLMGNRWRLGDVGANGMEVQFGVFGPTGGWRVPISTSYSLQPAYQRRRRIGSGR